MTSSKLRCLLNLIFVFTIFWWSMLFLFYLMGTWFDLVSHTYTLVFLFDLMHKEPSFFINFPTFIFPFISPIVSSVSQEGMETSKPGWGIPLPTTRNSSSKFFPHFGFALCTLWVAMASSLNFVHNGDSS